MPKHPLDGQFEPAAEAVSIAEPKQWSVAEIAAASTAISLKRIADVLEAGLFAAPVNAYGEHIGEAIQNQIERGLRGINTNDR